MSDDQLTRTLLAAVLQARQAGEQVARTSTGLFRLATQGPLRFAGEGMKMANQMVVEALRQALEIPQLRQAVEVLEAQQPTSSAVNAVLDHAEIDLDDEDGLRRSFEGLLERSVLPGDDEGLHPAFRRILAQLTPDEARLLRLFQGKGPQAVMDVVQAGRPLGRQGTVLARNLTRIGDHAGCVDPELGPLHLENLQRLGLVHIDDDELAGSDDYELLEVGRDFQAAARAASNEGHKVRGVRRTARLTALGVRLLEIVIPQAP